MHELAGAFHLHSCYSDGSGTLREITAAARAAGTDFFVLSDHDTLQPRRDGWHGWHDGVLVIAGVEISCKRHCHVVATGPDEVAGLRHKPLRRVLFDLRNQRARAFVAHSHPARIHGWHLKAGGLNEWEVPGFTGVELWAFLHDVTDGLYVWQIPSLLTLYRHRITGPHPDTLAHYDLITRKRRFVALGSLDNHAVAVPFFGARILPYEVGFRTLRNHVLVEDLAGDAADADRVMDAIADGRVFLALDLDEDARGFRFEAEVGGQTVHMGDQRIGAGPARLRVRSPRPARLTLRKDGRVVAEAETDALDHRAEEPGVYRVEARIGGRPWVYTNPIYLRPEGWTDETEPDADA